MCFSGNGHKARFVHTIALLVCATLSYRNFYAALSLGLWRLRLWLVCDISCEDAGHFLGCRKPQIPRFSEYWFSVPSLHPIRETRLSWAQTSFSRSFQM